MPKQGNRSPYREDEIEKACFFAAPDATKFSQLLDLLVSECVLGCMMSGSGGKNGGGNSFGTSTFAYGNSSFGHSTHLNNLMQAHLGVNAGGGTHNISLNSSKRSYVDGAIRTVPLLASLPGQCPPVQKYVNSDVNHHHSIHYGPPPPDLNPLSPCNSPSSNFRGNANNPKPSSSPYGSHPDPSLPFDPETAREVFQDVSRRLFRVQECEKSLEDESERNRVLGTFVRNDKFVLTIGQEGRLNEIGLKQIPRNGKRWEQTKSKLKGHTAKINCVKVTGADAKFIISGSDDCCIRVWNRVNAECVYCWGPAAIAGTPKPSLSEVIRNSLHMTSI